MHEQKVNEDTQHVIKFFFFSVSAGIIQALSFTALNEVLKLEYKYAYLSFGILL